MANQNVWEFRVADAGSVFIEYNDVNNRIGNISFSVPAGVSYHVQLFDYDTLIYDETYGEGSYSESVPGNRQVKIVNDEGVPHAVLPDGLFYYLERIVP
jgi:hypothetical protein